MQLPAAPSTSCPAHLKCPPLPPLPPPAPCRPPRCACCASTWEAPRAWGRCCASSRTRPSSPATPTSVRGSCCVPPIGLAPFHAGCVGDLRNRRSSPATPASTSLSVPLAAVLSVLYAGPSLLQGPVTSLALHSLRWQARRMLLGHPGPCLTAPPIRPIMLPPLGFLMASFPLCIASVPTPGGCGACNPVVHVLEGAPKVFSVQMAWESQHEEPSNIAATLAAVGEWVRRGAWAGWAAGLQTPTGPGRVVVLHCRAAGCSGLCSCKGGAGCPPNHGWLASCEHPV